MHKSVNVVGFQGRRDPVIAGAVAGVAFGAFFVHPLAALAEGLSTSTAVEEVLIGAYHVEHAGLLLYHALIGSVLGMVIAAILASGFRRELDQQRATAEMQSQMLQAQRMESIGRLSSGVAHDFNNLLSALTIQLHLAKKHVDPDHQAAHPLTEAQRIAAKAGEMPKQLLTYARKKETAAAQVDLGQVVEDLLPLMQRLIGDGVAIDSDLARDCVASIDAGQFEQVLMNLAVNARDAMDGEGTLSIHLAPRLRRDDGHSVEEVVLTVADTGPGIPADIQPRVFDPFFTTKEEDKGTGLGLSTCSRILAEHGGDITVGDAEGGGAVFVVTLPLAPSPPLGTDAAATNELTAHA